MKKSELNWLFTAFVAMILAAGLAGCEKDSAYLPMDDLLLTEAKSFDLPVALKAILSEQEITDYVDQLTEVDALTPEGYLMIPFYVSLKAKAESYYDGADVTDPFAVTFTGTGHDETLGYVSYFERMEMRPGKGQAIKGIGRLEYDASMETRCIPSFHTMFFTTFPAEVWEPLPVGNYNAAAPALIKGGLAGFYGAYGEAYRTITFVEGNLEKGIGYFYGFVYVPVTE